MMKLSRWTTLFIVVLLVSVVAVAGACSSAKANQPPTITSLAAVPTSLAPGGGSTVTCVAADPDGDTLNYAWEYTGGTLQGTGSTVTWIAPSVVNTYTVKVSVNDGKGGVANTSVAIIVTAPTEGSIDIKSNPTGAKVIIDGNDTNSVTPYLAIHIASGNHTVELEYAHYVWRQGVVTVVGGETLPIDWALTYAVDKQLNISLNHGIAGKDAWVYEYLPEHVCSVVYDYPLGSTGTYQGFYAGADPAGNRSRAYIQFDMSSLPSGAVIENASLGLFYWSEAMTASAGPIGVYKVTSSWNASLITWNHQPRLSSTATDTVTVPAAITEDFLFWDITGLVKGWQDSPSTNYGVMLRDTDENTNEGFKGFYSDGSDVASQHPELIITYYNPMP